MEKPFFTIALIVRESSYLTPFSIDSILRQSSTDYEVIIVQTGLSQNMQAILNSYQKENFHIHVEEDGNLAKLMNKAIELARGEYIQFLYPGDHLLFNHSLKTAKEIIEKEGRPVLFYSSKIERSAGEPEAEIHELSLDLLQKGKTPTRLHACWFQRAAFEKMGLFNEQYQYRAGFDLFLRLFHQHQDKIVSKHRVLVDYEYRLIPAHIIFRYVLETTRLLYRYFGLYHAIKWLFIQDRRVFQKWLLYNLRKIFVKG